MAVAFDAVGPGASGTSSTTSPLTWSHTNSAAGNAFLVGVNYQSGTSPQTSAVSYGAASLSRLGTVPADNAGPGGVELWGVIGGLPTGANTVSVTFTTAGNHTAGGSVSLTGAATFGAAFTNFASSTSVSVNVTGTTSGNLIFAVASVGNDTGFSTTSPGVQRWAASGDNSSGADNTIAGTWAAPGGTQAVGFANASSDFWALVAVEVQAPVATAAPLYAAMANRPVIVPVFIGRSGAGHSL